MDLIQILIFITGAISVLFVNVKNKKLNKWAPVIGISGQPFWFYDTWQNEQWGIFILAIVYTIAWAIGLYHMWVKKK